MRRGSNSRQNKQEKALVPGCTVGGGKPCADDPCANSLKKRVQRRSQYWPGLTGFTYGKIKNEIVTILRNIFLKNHNEQIKNLNKISDSEPRFSVQHVEKSVTQHQSYTKSCTKSHMVGQARREACSSA